MQNTIKHAELPLLRCEGCGDTEVGMIPHLDLLLCEPCGLVAVGLLPDYTAPTEPIGDEVSRAISCINQAVQVLHRHGVIDDTWMSINAAFNASMSGVSQAAAA